MPMAGSWPEAEFQCLRDTELATFLPLVRVTKRLNLKVLTCLECSECV